MARPMTETRTTWLALLTWFVLWGLALAVTRHYADQIDQWTPPPCFGQTPSGDPLLLTTPCVPPCAPRS